ncbi:MAG: roadblock/LC7 domain-containing protein [Polyangiaceae bacterium]|nr:roadblock/LC7 domain-containing protein [Polyangiaceae bacterium]
MASVNSLAQTIARGNPDVLGVLVVDGDGHVHASESTAPEIVRSAVAVAIPLRELLDRASSELGCGEMSATVLEGRDASLAIADVDGYRSVVVIGANGAAPGGLRADSLWIADRLRKEDGRA